MKPKKINPFVALVAAKAFDAQAVGAQIHAFMGDDGLKIVDGVGRTLLVTQIAAGRSNLFTKESPDIRIMRGTALALYQQSENPIVVKQHRASIISGLSAAQRILEDIPKRTIGESAILVNELVRGRDVNAIDRRRGRRVPGTQLLQHLPRAALR